jgi:hypothetical protein
LAKTGDINLAIDTAGEFWAAADRSGVSCQVSGSPGGLGICDQEGCAKSLMDSKCPGEEAFRVVVAAEGRGQPPKRVCHGRQDDDRAELHSVRSCISVLEFCRRLRPEKQRVQPGYVVRDVESASDLFVEGDADGSGVPLQSVNHRPYRNCRVVSFVSSNCSLKLLQDIETIWLNRGYDSDLTRERLANCALADAVIAKKRKHGAAEPKRNQPMGLRWPVERTNSWLSNFGQLRRNTDRRTVHRLAQFALAVVFLLAAKLIDWRNRWSPGCVPIR